MSQNSKDGGPDWSGYGLALIVTVLATAVSALLVRHIALTNLVMIYLLGVAFVASKCRPGAAVLASILGVAAFDFCFVPPGGTFAVKDVQYVFTFGVMLAVSLLISTLTVKLREQANVSQQAALQAQVEQMRADLLSVVSHDLRTPMASIGGSAEALLQQPELTEQSRQLAGTIHEESARMSELIRNLLDMTRVQGIIDLDLDWYSLDELVANAIGRTESMFEKPVQLKIAPGTPLARVDGVLIEQVFVNLLENAARHAGNGTQVTISVSATDSRLHITLADDGPGIPPGMEEQIFERFESSGGPGFGLGLAICRAAIEAHGGKIMAANSSGVGACFTIDLPTFKEKANA